MKRCLYISAHFPSYKAKYAGHKTAYKMLEKYAGSFNEIDLIVICNKGEIDRAVLKDLNNVFIKLLLPLDTKNKIINILKSRKFFPLKAMSRYSKKILNYLKDNIGLYDTIHFEFSHSAYPLLFFSKEFWDGKDIVVSCHDILIQSSLRKNFSIINAIDSHFTFYYEKQIFNKATKIIVQNIKDKNLIINFYQISDDKIEVIQPYISDFVYKVKELRKKVNPDNCLLFWGAMDRKENAEAVIEFVKRYKKILKKKGYKLCIVGANPGKEVLALHDEETVIVTGFVEDPTYYFTKAKYGIVPLLRGAGIKVKTLEMLEAGLKVISTPIGAEGIKHDNLLIDTIDNWEKWLDDLL